MSKVGITDHEGTKFTINLFRYAMAVSDKFFVFYTIAAMLVGGIVALWLLFVVFVVGGAL
jgi:hypothetical protein